MKSQHLISMRYCCLIILYLISSLFARESITPLTQSTVTFQPPDFSVRAMAEWEPLQGILISWDEVSDTASYEFSTPIDFKPVLAEIVRHAQQHTRVFVICNDLGPVKQYLQNRGISLHNVDLIRYGHNSVWSRDFGPWSVYDENTLALNLIDFMYSEIRYLDDQVSRGLAQFLNVPLFEGSKIPNNIINDGGNFMVDGYGRAFTSKLFLQSNLKMNQNLLKERIQRYLGIDDLVILPWEPSEHIDMYMKLLDEETLLVGEYPPEEENALQIEPNLKHIVNNLFTPYGRPYRIFRVPMPNLTPGYYFNDQGGYRTYTNSIIINDLVLVPVFGLPQDELALDTYRQAMPGYKIVGINCDEIVLSAVGALHCLTREIGETNPTLIQHGRLTGEEDQANGYQIKAKIRSANGIGEAELWYRLAKSDAYKKLNMHALENNDLYVATLPVLPAGSTVQYYFQVSNKSGAVTKKPIPAPEGYYEFTVQTVSAVQSSDRDLNLAQLTSYPNPFNLSTTIQYTLPDPGRISMRIFNLAGQQIKSWEKDQSSGSHTLVWNGLDEHGETVSSGTFFIRLQAGELLMTRKVLLIK